jgi:hypothetical protein
MYTGRHTIYQNLLLNDKTVRTAAPSEVRDFITNNEAYSRSGEPNKGEGGDYITENENRALKSHLPPGVPTLHSWVEASRNDENLKQNRKSVFQRLGIRDPGTEQTATFNVELEVQMFRRQLRASKLFEEPFKLEPLVSVEGNVLCPDLVIFYLTLTTYYESYLSDQSNYFETSFCNFW